MERATTCRAAHHRVERLEQCAERLVFCQYPNGSRQNVYQNSSAVVSGRDLPDFKIWQIFFIQI
jgi:hypothetical protein